MLVIHSVLLMLFACGEYTPTTNARIDQPATVQQSASSSIALPSGTHRNIFHFFDQTEDVVLIPWKEWKMLGTFAINQQQHSAILLSPSKKHYVFSTESSLPINGWQVFSVDTYRITFADREGNHYSMEAVEP